MAIDFPTGNDPAADLSSVEDSPAKLVLLKKLKRRKPPIITTQSFYVGDNIFQSNGNQPVPGQYLGGVAIASNQSLPVVGEYFGQPVVMGLPLEQEKSISSFSNFLELSDIALSLSSPVVAEATMGFGSISTVLFQIIASSVSDYLKLLNIPISVGGTADPSDYIFSPVITGENISLHPGRLLNIQVIPSSTYFSEWNSIDNPPPGKPPRTISLTLGNGDGYQLIQPASKTVKILQALYRVVFVNGTFGFFNWSGSFYAPLNGTLYVSVFFANRLAGMPAVPDTVELAGHTISSIRSYPETESKSAIFSVVQGLILVNINCYSQSIGVAISIDY